MTANGVVPHDSPHFQLPFYRAQPAGTLPDATYCSRLGHVTQRVTPVARLSFSAPVCFHLAFRNIGKTPGNLRRFANRSG
jgi:hypothetical protein